MILVTGGLGFIGSNLCQMLLRQGHRVRVLDNGLNCASCSTDPRSMDGVEVAWDDIRGHGDSVWKDVHAVVHLAAITGVEDCEKNPQEAWSVNKHGTESVLQKAKQHNVQQFVLASSVGAVLGVQEQPAREDQTPRPQSVYGSTKKSAETQVLERKDQMATCILRFTNVYGTYSQRKRNVIPKLFRHDPVKPFTVYGDGKQVRDFIYAEDVCAAILKAIEKRATGLYHIGSGEPTTLLQLLIEVGKVRGRPTPVTFAEERSGDVRENTASVELAKSVLGWEATTPLADGLEKTYHWFLT